LESGDRWLFMVSLVCMKKLRSKEDIGFLGKFVHDPGGR
jgi:hypothetical protein